jgi:hypothetical protein
VNFDRSGALRLVYDDTTSRYHGAHLFEIRQLSGKAPASPDSRSSRRRAVAALRADGCRPDPAAARPDGRRRLADEDGRRRVDIYADVDASHAFDLKGK